MKKIIGISLLSAVGMFAQGTAPATPPAASGTQAPAAKTQHKKHHHKKAGTAAPAASATPVAPAK